MPRTSYTGFFRPSFIVDHQSVDRDNGHQIDWDNVPEDFRETAGGTVTLNGAAAADAVTITVDPLTFVLPAGTRLHFGQSKEFALTTADEPIGETTVAVEALPSALEDNDFSIVSGSGLKTLKPGIVMGIASDGTMYPRVVTTNPADGLLATHAVEGSKVAALSGYGLIIGGVVYENLLPEATGTPPVLASAVKTELAANSKGFVFRQYSDDRAS